MDINDKITWLAGLGNTAVDIVLKRYNLVDKLAGHFMAQNDDNRIIDSYISEKICCAHIIDAFYAAFSED